MSVTERVFNDNKNRCEEVNRFRDGYFTQHLTSVDLEKILRVGGVKKEFFGGFVCDNLDFNPFEDLVIDITAKGNKFKKQRKDLLQTPTKKRTNAVYGYTIRADIEYGYNCVSSHWMRTEYDDRVKEQIPFKNEIIVVKINDHDGVNDNVYSKKNSSQPCPLGSFILSHSKRLMNDVILALDGFENNKILYSDTDGVYIHKNDYEIIKEQRLIGKTYLNQKTIMVTLVLYMVGF